MATLPTAFGKTFMCDLQDVQEAVKLWDTQDSWHQILYRKWEDFYPDLLVNPIIQDPPLL